MEATKARSGADGNLVLTRRQAVMILRKGSISGRRMLREAYRKQGAPNGDTVGGFVAFMVEAANTGGGDHE